MFSGTETRLLCGMGNSGVLAHMIVRVGSQTLGLVRFRIMLQGTFFLLAPFTSTKIRSFGNVEFLPRTVRIRQSRD